jgi:threonylcarbamoyladenosine tRNA methylthiotransferase MtaB
MKIYLDTIGCRLNQAEIESMARQFRAAGHDLVGSPELADMAVVNTCTVTNEAAADSRGKIRQIARLGVDQIVATGCWSTLQPKEAASLPKVSYVVPNHQKEFLVADVLEMPRDLSTHSGQAFDIEPLAREPLPGLHRRTRAFIKVQDGCDNHCTFCITTVARGESRSRPIVEVLADIQSALLGGTKEIVLTGVHLGSWGQEFGYHLRDLVKAILRETDVPRLRLSSLEPWDLDAEFFALWDDRRLMPHLHLPLQSGCEYTLKRMARKTSPDSFRDLLAAARSVMPDAAITTDIIAGFPGETEDEFAKSLAFVREMNFAGGHVFTYSPRPGTGAARMKGQVWPEVRKERNRILQDALKESGQAYRQKFLGQTLSVLWEATSELGEWGWQMEGLTGNYLRVTANALSARWNIVDEVKLTALTAGGLSGEIL